MEGRESRNQGRAASATDAAAAAAAAACCTVARLITAELPEWRCASTPARDNTVAWVAVADPDKDRNIWALLLPVTAVWMHEGGRPAPRTVPQTCEHWRLRIPGVRPNHHRARLRLAHPWLVDALGAWQCGAVQRTVSRPYEPCTSPLRPFGSLVPLAAAAVTVSMVDPAVWQRQRQWSIRHCSSRARQPRSLSQEQATI